MTEIANSMTEWIIRVISQMPRPKFKCNQWTLALIVKLLMLISLNLKNIWKPWMRELLEGATWTTKLLSQVKTTSILWKRCRILCLESQRESTEGSWSKRSIKSLQREVLREARIDQLPNACLVIFKKDRRRRVALLGMMSTFMLRSSVTSILTSISCRILMGKVNEEQQQMIMDTPAFQDRVVCMIKIARQESQEGTYLRQTRFSS